MATDALTKAISQTYGYNVTEATIDAARTAGQIYLDGNNQIRMAGTGAIVTGTHEAQALQGSTVTTTDKQFARQRGNPAACIY